MEILDKLIQEIKKQINKHGKKIRKMKNSHKRGKSAKRGNAPSPYTKYNKSPYQYSFKSAKQKEYAAETRKGRAA